MNKNTCANVEVTHEMDEEYLTESQWNVKELTDPQIREDKEKDNNGEDVEKKHGDEEKAEKEFSSEDVPFIEKSGKTEYFLCSSNTWEPEETLNISNSSTVVSYSSVHLKYQDIIKIDEDETEYVNHSVHKNNTSKRRRNKKRKRSATHRNILENKDHKEKVKSSDKVKSSVKVVKKNTPVEQMNTNEVERRMSKKRKKAESSTHKKLIAESSTMKKLTLTESLTRKKLTLAESSKNKKLTLTELLISKKLKLVKKSKMDIMLRRKKCEIMNELRKYKDEKLKNIDSEVTSMKRDLLSYMLKEVEEHKKVMLMNMEKGIEEEKAKRLRIIELELSSKVFEDKSIQTISYPETIDEKYEQILKELKEIKNSSNRCKNILTKQNIVSSLNLKSNDSPPINKRLTNPSASLKSSPVLSISQDSTCTSQSSTQHSYHSNSKDWLPKITSKFEVSSSKDAINKNLGMPLENIALCYKNVPSRENNRNVSSRENNTLHGNNLVNLMSTKENTLCGRNFPNSSHDDVSSYIKKVPINSPENSILYHRYRSPKENIKLQMSNQRSPQEDAALYNHSLALHCQENIPFNKNLPSQDDNTALYIMVSKDNTAMVSKDNTSSKQNFSTSQENDPSYMNNLQFLTQQNVSTRNKNSTSPHQNTSVYIKNLLSSDENALVCHQTSTIPTENTASYIKNLLISSQLGSPQENALPKINHNVTIPYGKDTHHIKPTLISSEDTALYIKNLLMSSHDNTSPITHNSTLPKNISNKFNKSSPICSLENASLYTRPNTQQNDSLGNKKMVYPNTENTAYNIYTYNKKLISSQENSMLYNRNMDDITSLTVRKKREINKRVFEKYGPLHNHKEISEQIQSDPIFLSLSLMEQNGILSCLTRSVAEHLTFSKDLLEELFSREVLSISSCKGSPIKTALNADKLALIKKIVFFALPSEDEGAVWEMIQDCIDTKCRGILRNMKKKLSKQTFEC